MLGLVRSKTIFSGSYKGLSSSVATSKNRLKDLESAPSADEKRVRLRKRLLELSKKRVKISHEYTVGFSVRACRLRMLTDSRLSSNSSMLLLPIKLLLHVVALSSCKLVLIRMRLMPYVRKRMQGISERLPISRTVNYQQVISADICSSSPVHSSPDLHQFESRGQGKARYECRTCTGHGSRIPGSICKNGNGALTLKSFIVLEKRGMLT